MSKLHDGFISKNINRKISGFITSKIISFEIITPNIVSGITLLLTLLAALSLYNRYFIFSALLIQFASIVDGVDGEIARIRNQQTFFGAWLDRILDRIGEFIIYLSIYLVMRNQNESYASLLFFSLIFINIIYWITGELSIVLDRFLTKSSANKFSEILNKIKLYNYGKHDFVMLLISICVLFRLFELLFILIISIRVLLFLSRILNYEYRKLL